MMSASTCALAFIWQLTGSAAEGKISPLDVSTLPAEAPGRLWRSGSESWSPRSELRSVVV